MEIMKGYQPVKDYLGEPIGASWFDMTEDSNKCDGLNAHVNILYNVRWDCSIRNKGYGFKWTWETNNPTLHLDKN